MQAQCQIIRSSGRISYLRLKQRSSDISYQLKLINYLQQKMSDTKNIKPQEEQFENTLAKIHELMLSCQKDGNYVQAENLRRKGMAERKIWEDYSISQMKNRHDDQLQNLFKDYQTKLTEINNQWELRNQSYANSCRKNFNETDKNNEIQIQELRKNMDQELTPNKMKETYQLLNLRQMEHHMAKQKDFTQAHLIQQRIKQVYEAELKAWKEDCSNKIEQAATNLKARHAKQRDLLFKKIQIQKEDSNNQQHLQEIDLQNRYKNTLKQIKAAQERQFHSFKRSFKTKGGIFSDKYVQSQ